MLKRMGSALTKYTLRVPHLPHSFRPVKLPPPPTGNDIQSLIIQNAKKNLDKMATVWAANLYALGTSLYANLLSVDFQNKSNLKSKETREFISDYVDTWNMSRKTNLAKDDKNLDALEGLFSPMIAAIKYGDNLKNPNDVFLSLLKWDLIRTNPSQSSFDFIVQIGKDNLQQGAVLIKTDQYAHQLEALYGEWILNYEHRKFNPSFFVYQAHIILGNYFNELQKLNLDQSNNHWGRPEIQQALSYYFDQRELLYKIYSKTAACPLRDNKIFDTIQLMRKYTKYIQEMLARPEEYTTTIGPFNFGCDRVTKINAAFDFYYKTCGIPGDEIPERDPLLQQSIDAAKTQGRLSKIHSAS